MIDDAKRVIKIDSDESDASSVGALSPRIEPLTERDVLSDNGEAAAGTANQAKEGDVIQ